MAVPPRGFATLHLTYMNAPLRYTYTSTQHFLHLIHFLGFLHFLQWLHLLWPWSNLLHLVVFATRYNLHDRVF